MNSAESWRVQYPFASHYLTLDGARLHYVDEGHSDHTLLMVHGNPTWSFYWRRLVEAFRPDYRVIAVDHIGCGLSDKPPSYRYTLAQHIDNLAALVAHLDLQHITLIAHDWGGAIGLGTLLGSRQRFRAAALLNTGAFPPPFIPWRIRACRIPWLGSWAIRRWNLFARAALWMAVAKSAHLDPPARAGLLAPYDSWEHRIAIDRFVKDIPANARHENWSILQRMEDDLKQLADLPVQLIWGMQDWCFRPSCLERFERIFPQATARRLPEASHYVVEDAPDQVIDCLRQFLQPAPG